MNIEPLESRIAPATLVSPTTVTFQDADGDDVTIKVSKPIFTDAATAATLVTFSGSMFGDSGPQQLAQLAFAGLAATNNGMDVSVTAKRSPANGGNGEVRLESINASDVNTMTGAGPGIDLGKVRVQGDVNYVDAGDTDLATPAIKMLDLRSLGAVADGVSSDIFGAIGAVKIRGTMQGKILTHSGPGDNALAGIGSVFIGGSMGAYDGTGGVVDSEGRVGTFMLKGDLVGGKITGSGKIMSGEVVSFGGFGKLTVAGSIVGGTAVDTGGIVSFGKIDALTVGGSLVGTLDNSGKVSARQFGAVKIGGDFVGGTGMDSGQISSGSFSADRIFIGGSIIGGDGLRSGRVNVLSKSEVVKGSIVGGAGTLSGSVNGPFVSFTLGGSIIGGTGPSSGFFTQNGGTAKIGGSIIGGSESDAGLLFVNRGTSLVVKGSLIGGSGAKSGSISVIEQNFGSITVGGSLRGQAAIAGGQASTGSITSIFGIASVTIGGDVVAASIAVGVVAGADNFFGTGDDAAFSTTVAKLGKLIIKGSVLGTATAGDHFAILSNQIGLLSVGGIVFKPTDPGVNYAAGFLLGGTGDFTVKTI